jgi:hypothetical protein
LQREIETLRPIDYKELTEAADLIQNFDIYWNQCEQAENPVEARRQLVSQILRRAFVYDDKVIATNYTVTTLSFWIQTKQRSEKS